MNILKNTLLGLFFGTFGTTIGGIIGLKFVCFDLIPEALKVADFSTAIVGIIFGIFIMIFCDMIVQNKLQGKKSSLLKTGIAVGVGLALHNFPEGLSIGAGFEASLKLRIFFSNYNCNS